MKLRTFFQKNASFFAFVIALLAMRWSFADQYQVPTGSMERTIHIGDRIFVNKAAYDLRLPFTNLSVKHISDPQRGSILVFKSVEDSSMTLVKRLIGLPGDHIRIENGFVSINGTPLEGSSDGQLALAQMQSFEIFYRENFGSKSAMIRREPNRTKNERFDFIVPAGQYFMMGDNRDDSYDSRYWGFVPRESIKGEALRVLWNFSVANWLPHMELDRIGAEL